MKVTPNMQIGIYDSAQSSSQLGRGWLWRGSSISKNEVPVWEEVVNLAADSLEKDGSRLRPSIDEVYWGILNRKDKFWFFQVVAAGRDHFNRPGRYIVLLFSVDSATGISWGDVFGIQREFFKSLPSMNPSAPFLKDLDDRENGLRNRLHGVADNRFTSNERSVQKEVNSRSSCVEVNSLQLLVFNTVTGELVRNRQSNFSSTVAMNDQIRPNAIAPTRSSERGESTQARFQAKNVQPASPTNQFFKPKRSRFRDIGFLSLGIVLGIFIGAIGAKFSSQDKGSSYATPEFTTDMEAIDSILRAAHYLKRKAGESDPDSGFKPDD